MVSLKHLRAFCVLGETLHFGRAAARLNLSQPPLSRQIASLEHELGVALFTRNTRAVALTHAGERYLVDAKMILALLDQAKASAVAAGRGEQGSLSVGFTSCAAYSVVPTLARSYSTHFPNVTFRLRELLLGDLTTFLLEGYINAAIMFPPEAHLRLNTKRIYSEPICAVLPCGHALAGRNAIKIGDLAEDAFVLAPRSAAPMLYDAIISHCNVGGFEPRVRLETHLQQTIVNLVAEGVGVALVPQSLQKTQLSGVVFKPIVDAPVVHLVVAWTRHDSNPCLQEFLKMPTTVSP